MNLTPGQVSVEKRALPVLQSLGRAPVSVSTDRIPAAESLQRLQAAQPGATPTDVRALQRAIGNRAVAQLLQAAPPARADAVARMPAITSAPALSVGGHSPHTIQRIKSTETTESLLQWKDEFSKEAKDAKKVEPDASTSSVGSFTTNGNLMEYPDTKSSTAGKFKSGQLFAVIKAPAQKRVKKKVKYGAIDDTVAVDVPGWLEVSTIPLTSGGPHAAGYVQDGEVERKLGDYGAVEEAPLIPEGENPKPEHVKQGLIGNCYLMAAMMAVAAQQPEKIVNMFNPDPHTKGKGDVTVRLYKALDKAETKFEPVYATVSKSFIVTASQYLKRGKTIQQGQRAYANGPALWPAVIEKAYAGLSGGYFNIDGGKTYKGFYVLLGKEYTGAVLDSDYTKDVGKRGSGKYSDKLKGIYLQIKDALIHNEVVGLGTKTSWEGVEGMESKKVGHGNREEPIMNGLAAGHAYAVLGTFERDGLLYLRVRNPWGQYGRKYKRNWLKLGKLEIKTVKGEKGAVSEIELSDVPRHFEQVHYKKDGKITLL